MANTIPKLWPEDIKVDILAPLVILRAQANALAEITQDILRAEVRSTTTEKMEIHRLDLIATVFRSRHRILKARHRRDRAYPVTIEATCFDPEPPKTLLERGLAQLAQESLVSKPPRGRRAATQQEFISLVGEVLRSAEVRSLIDSLIARSNEKRGFTAELSQLEADEADSDVPPDGAASAD